MRKLLLWLTTWSAVAAETPAPNWNDWAHQGKMAIVTTPQGVALPPNAKVENFPLLVRLHQDWFNFSEAQPHGEDLRFTNAENEVLDFQIEDWNPTAGTAAIWVRIPVIAGMKRDYLQLHWGNPRATAASNGAAVFNANNHFLSVWHMGTEVKDETGLLKTQDTGTEATAGIIGKARHFSGKGGLFGGDKITSYPVGSSPHSTELWFRPEKTNTRLIAWGNEQQQGKMVMQYSSPSKIRNDCYFSDGNVESAPFPTGTWTHVFHTYEKGQSLLYINGELAGKNVGRSSPLNIRTPARLWIGGWYNQYDFVGDMDEVRVSNETRSPTWVKLTYENQKPLQTLHGIVIQKPAHPAINQERVTLNEGETQKFTVSPGDAEQIIWTLQTGDQGKPEVVATNVLNYTFKAGRVTQNTTLLLRAQLISSNQGTIFQSEIKVKKYIPDPIVSLPSLPTWDGRQKIEISPAIANLDELKAKHGEHLNIHWQVEPFAVTQKMEGDKLVLLRAQKSGTLKISASLDNGGPVITTSTTLKVEEPANDAWVTRTPDAEEKPEDHQFFGCDDRHEGTLYYQGKVATPTDKLVLTVWSENQVYQQTEQRPDAKNHYAFTVKLKPGLVHYRTELKATQAGATNVLHEAHDLVCGDAFILMGQSNAVSTDWGKEEPPTFTSEWIRTLAITGNGPQSPHTWGNAIYRGGKLQIGYWGMELSKRLVDKHQIPICIINGAVGGTRIDQHQRSLENPSDSNTLYGRLLQRVKEAHLTHQIRGIFWHQGENDQGADGPLGDFGYQHYRAMFLQLAADWKTDYPNIEGYISFQIWPKSCAMGVNGSDNHLREVQRNLPNAFKQFSMMSTLGIEPPGGCHFPPAGYTELARLVFPIVERDFYHAKFEQAVTSPNLLKAVLSKQKSELTLTFDQPVTWNPALVSQFYLDGQSDQITEGSTEGNTLKLKVKVTEAKHVTYLDSKAWSQKNLLRGTNGLAAFTFCEVPLELIP